MSECHCCQQPHWKSSSGRSQWTPQMKVPPSFSPTGFPQFSQTIAPHTKKNIWTISLRAFILAKNQVQCNTLTHNSLPCSPDHSYFYEHFSTFLRVITKSRGSASAGTQSQPAPTASHLKRPWHVQHVTHRAFLYHRCLPKQIARSRNTGAEPTSGRRCPGSIATFGVV